MPLSLASSLLYTLQKAPDEEQHPRSIIDFIDSLERRFPSSRLRRLFMANPFYPFPPPQLPDDITAADLNAIGVGFNLQPNPNASNAPHTALSGTPAGSDNSDPRAVRRRLDEPPHAGVNPMQILNNPSVNVPGTGAFVPSHHVPSNNLPYDPTMYAHREHAPPRPHSYASMYPLAHAYGQPAYPMSATPMLSLSATTPAAQQSVGQATTQRSMHDLHQPPPIPSGTRPGGGGTLANLHDQLLASLAAAAMPGPGPPSSTSRTHSGSPGNTSLSFARHSGTSVTSFPSNAASSWPHDQQADNSWSHTDAQNMSTSYNPLVRMMPPQGRPSSFDTLVHHSHPRSSSGPSGSQLLRTPGLQSVYNPRNSPPHIATRAESPTSSLVFMSSPVHAPSDLPVQGTQVVTGDSRAVTPDLGDDEPMDLDAQNEGEEQPHMTGNNYSKDLYPIGLPFISADERIALFSVDRASCVWLFCEKSVLFLGLFSAQTKAHKNVLWKAFKAPNKGKYHPFITSIRNDIFNKSRSESALWHNARNLASTYVSIWKFEAKSSMKWNYDLADEDLFPVIQAEIDEHATEDSGFSKLLACEYVVWTRPGDKRWLDLARYHLRDHPSYKTSMLRSGDISDEPDQVGAPTNHRTSQQGSATSHHNTRNASASASQVAKGKKRALPVDNAEVSEVVPSPPPSTANSSTRPTSTPRSLIRKATAPRTADRTTSGGRSQLDEQQSIRSSGSSRPATLEFLRHAEHTGKQSVKIQREMAVSEERLNNVKAVAVFKEVQQQHEWFENDKRLKDERLKLERAQAREAAKAERRKNFQSFLVDLQKSTATSDEIVKQAVQKQILDTLQKEARAVEADEDERSLTPPPHSTLGVGSSSLLSSSLPPQTEGAGPSAAGPSVAASHATPQPSNLSDLDAWIGPGSAFGNVDEFGCAIEEEEPGGENLPLEYVPDVE
ncbi:hypothetical protein FRC10_002107 [Ceratobasidium sp. 414]|nr:hypothetical protein FRC10_002107 [Ceratobasidium sp. 414]